MKRYPLIADHGLVGDLQTCALISDEGVVDWFAAPRFDSPGIFSALLDHDRGGYFRLSLDALDDAETGGAPPAKKPTASTASAAPTASTASTASTVTTASTAPTASTVTTKQLYYPDTALLVTRFMAPDGVGELIDWMPPDRTGRATDRHTILRVLRCTRGTVTFSMECRPRFGFADNPHETHVDGRTATFRAPGLAAYLQSNIPMEQDGPYDVRGRLTLREGDVAGAAFTVDGPEAEPPPLPMPGEVETALWDAVDFWQGWVRTARYRGRWPDMVHRSAITLKLLTYLPTGAPIAAATLGLPELVGGERNWDYRYTWIRDGSLAVRALLDLGFVDEAAAFTGWLTERVTERASARGAVTITGPGTGDVTGGDGTGPNGTRPLQIMYRVDGDPWLPEEILTGFEGYRGSSPVRVGNAAADQLQLDIYGEALYALAQGRARGSGPGAGAGPGVSPGVGAGAGAGVGSAGTNARPGPGAGLWTGLDTQPTHEGWQAVSALLDWLAKSWDGPDEGIWETRGGRQDFTFSRVMSWVAFDRGLRLAEEFGRPAALETWRAARDEIYAQVMHRGWNERRRALVQYYGGEVLDAALLLIPRSGLLSPTDPVWLSTLDAIERNLVHDSLVHRYDPGASPDGLRGAEGTFSLCTFLYVDALARAGRVRQARFTFEKMLTYANHVGLFAEEIGPSGEQLGNFPQAFTHLSLIMAATTLDEVLDGLSGAGGLTRLDRPGSQGAHPAGTTTWGAGGS
ncbi:glycoside hydrolase family 15 protein [Streptomyces roseicoloratus]|uniref:Glycoside hydrolase family 15 protein n=1 Tax=Streptomyces roseicoloratus TaxID=2508722 RepID=A0ABY9RUN0_9ACTN|nr:glycoside hydrolase family 15 protein [Streptomyces roseicoloratus]WMX45647.1 glycoside hydrolase family 15 protein [Streptomyces roseicoloratus]